MRKGLLLSFVLLIFFTTGCVKMNNTLVINKDGSSDLTMIYGLDSQLYAMGDASKSIDDMKKDAEQNGFKVVNYKDSKVIGIKISKHFKNYKDITIAKNPTSDNGISLKVNETKGFFKTKYKVKSIYDLTGMTDSMGSESEEEFDQQMINSVIGQMDLNFTLKLPVEAGENNASSVSNSGKTLKWELIPDEKNELNVVFEKINILNIVLLIVGIGLVLLTGLFILLKRRKKTSEFNM
jgi:hypothetical protein